MKKKTNKLFNLPIFSIAFFTSTFHLAALTFDCEVSTGTNIILKGMNQAWKEVFSLRNLMKEVLCTKSSH